MPKITNFYEGNPNIKTIENHGGFRVIEYQKDLSVGFQDAMYEYFASEMNVRRRQVVCDMTLMNQNNVGATISAGAMQFMVGNVEMTTGVRGAGDLVGKMFRGAVTKESAIKPEYRGTGLLVLEPTYKHLLVEDLSSWGGGVVLDDGAFLACHSNIQQSTVARSSISSAVAGGEGLFNLMLSGGGTFVMESDVPRSELVKIELQNEEIKIDGPYAVCWSPSLQFTVERSSKTLIGSAASGEGLVNVYRGTGIVLMAPVTNDVKMMGAAPVTGH